MQPHDLDIWVKVSAALIGVALLGVAVVLFFWQDDRKTTRDRLTALERDKASKEHLTGVREELGDKIDQLRDDMKERLDLVLRTMGVRT